jgi:hypothetical protein
MARGALTDFLNVASAHRTVERAARRLTGKDSPIVVVGARGAHVVQTGPANVKWLSRLAFWSALFPRFARCLGASVPKLFPRIFRVYDLRAHADLPESFDAEGARH